MLLQEISSQAQWDQFVSNNPHGHPLQLWGWGELKRQNRWTPYRLAITEGDEILAAAQVLMWPIPKTGKRVAYVPRGPVAAAGSKEASQLLAGLTEFAREHRALYLHVEPSWQAAKLPAGWQNSVQTILLSETYTVNLTKDESELQAAMRSKTRQYIRKAQSLGVKIRRLDPSASIDEQAKYLAEFWRIYSHTSKRAGFGLHEFNYYQTLWQELGDHNYLYFAEVGGRAVAFLWLVEAAGTAFELYGGIDEQGSALKANYLLKWQAIASAREHGNQLYDFNGRLNEGVSQFKEGFGPDETRFVGAWDFPVDKIGYTLWQRFLPALKPIGRRILKAGKK